MSMRLRATLLWYTAVVTKSQRHTDSQKDSDSQRDTDLDSSLGGGEVDSGQGDARVRCAEHALRLSDVANHALAEVSLLRRIGGEDESQVRTGQDRTGQGAAEQYTLRSAEEKARVYKSAVYAQRWDAVNYDSAPRHFSRCSATRRS